VTFTRLRLADWVVFLAALALLFATAADWYSTKGGEQARQFQKSAPTRGEEAELADDAAATAEKAERNAWQADGGIDRVILVGVLLTVALAVYAAFARAAGRGSGPIALAGLAAALTALLVVYRVLQEPGVDEVNTVQPGAPIALAILGVIALACAMSLRREEEAPAGEAPAVREPEPAP
jgi:hypothetical protein